MGLAGDDSTHVASLLLEGRFLREDIAPFFFYGQNLERKAVTGKPCTTNVESSRASVALHARAGLFVAQRASLNSSNIN